MAQKPEMLLDGPQVQSVLDNIPVGVTVTDPDGRILYYNAYSATIVDRRPEHIGMDIRSCHKKPESVSKIDRIFSEMKAGTRREFYYETLRGGRTLAVTVQPYEVDGSLVGFLHSFVVKR